MFIQCTVNGWIGLSGEVAQSRVEVVSAGDSEHVSTQRRPRLVDLALAQVKRRSSVMSGTVQVVLSAFLILSHILHLEIVT